MTKYFLLNGKEIIECNGMDDYLEKVKIYGNNNRIKLYVKGKVKVSTVLLLIDHNLFGEGGPSIFETMIFGGKHDGYIERCGVYSQALIMHDKAVSLLKEKKV